MVRFAYLFFGVLFIVSLASAEPQRGRLPDGKAYRTDAAGNQIVDYVAELELEIDSLKRRVHGLEYELEEKQRVISRTSSGKDTGLQEKDLLGGGKKTFGKTPQPKFAGAPVETTKNCSTDIQSALADVKLKHDRERLQASNERGTLKKKIQELEQQLSQELASKTDNKAKTVAFSEKERDYKQKLSSLTQTNDKLEQQLQELHASLEKKESEIRSLDEKIQQVTLQSKKVSSPPYARPQATGRKQTIRSAALDSLKGSVKKDVQRLKRLIAERDKLFASYKRRGGRALSVTPKKAISSRGRSVGQIEALLRKATMTAELTQLQRDVREIASNIKNDLAFIKRMRQFS